MPTVPQVRLADPNVEPTDEELEALMREVQKRVIERARKARIKLEKDLDDALEEARSRKARTYSCSWPKWIWQNILY